MTQVELVIEQGATFRRTFTWLTGTPSAPVNLTGYSARMQIRKTTASSAVYATLTSANGGIVLGGAAGTIELFISAVDTAAYSWSTGVYDLELVAPSGDVRRLIGGAVRVDPEVTR